jgi:transposase-like protein
MMTMMMIQKLTCPYCKNDDERMMNNIRANHYYCGVCSKTFEVKNDNPREDQGDNKDTEEKIPESND